MESFANTLLENEKQKKFTAGAGEMVQQFKMLAASLGTWDGVLEPTWKLTTICNSSFRGLIIPFWTQVTPSIHVVKRYSCKQTPTHKIN